MSLVANRATGIEVARVVDAQGRRIVVVAVRQNVLSDATRAQAVRDLLGTMFPDQYVALIASTSEGLKISTETPSVAETVRRKKTSLDWHRYSFA
jgi:hypothetical protein